MNIHIFCHKKNAQYLKTHWTKSIGMFVVILMQFLYADSKYGHEIKHFWNFWKLYQNNWVRHLHENGNYSPLSDCDRTKAEVNVLSPFNAPLTVPENKEFNSTNDDVTNITANYSPIQFYPLFLHFTLHFNQSNSDLNSCVKKDCFAGCTWKISWCFRDVLKSEECSVRSAIATLYYFKPLKEHSPVLCGGSEEFHIFYLFCTDLIRKSYKSKGWLKGLVYFDRTMK